MKKFKEIYKCLLTGVIVNACLDIPFILLLNALHLPPYIGTVLATCTGYITSITLALITLKKDMKFEYQSTLNVLKKVLIPCIVMIIPVIIGNFFITYTMSKLNALIALAVYGGIGMIIYLVITYYNNALYDVFGEDMVNGFLKKLHLKK